jgi:hypothetical protein
MASGRTDAYVGALNVLATEPAPQLVELFPANAMVGHRATRSADLAIKEGYAGCSKPVQLSQRTALRFRERRSNSPTPMGGGRVDGFNVI